MSIDFTKIPLGIIEGRKVDSGIYSYRTLVGADAIESVQYSEEVSKVIDLPIRDQGDVGACWAFSLARVMEIQHYMETGEIVKLSEGYIYYLKCFHDYSGMSPLFDIDNAVKLGTVLQEDFNYIGEWNDLDTHMKSLGEERKSELAKKANKFRAKSYLSVSKDELSAYLHHHYAGIITIDVHHSFYKVNKETGVVPFPSGTKVGGHAMTFVGLEKIDGKLGVWCDNSWTETFGKKGMVWIDLDNPCIQRFYGFVDATPITSEIVFLVGKKTMYTSRGNFDLPVAPIYVKDEVGQSHAMLPMRAFAECFGKDVTWEKRENGQDRICFSIKKSLGDMLELNN